MTAFENPGSYESALCVTVARWQETRDEEDSQGRREKKRETPGERRTVGSVTEDTPRYAYAAKDASRLHSHDLAYKTFQLKLADESYVL